MKPYLVTAARQVGEGSSLSSAMMLQAASPTEALSQFLSAYLSDANLPKVELEKIAPDLEDFGQWLLREALDSEESRAGSENPLVEYLLSQGQLDAPLGIQGTDIVLVPAESSDGHLFLLLGGENSLKTGKSHKITQIFVHSTLGNLVPLALGHYKTYRI